ncbi:MAG: TlyA family RNA methyltransferase [Nitrospinota bacterium]
MKSSKKRLDSLLIDLKLVASRSIAKSMILAGKVMVDNKVADKVGELTKIDASIRVKASKSNFVSRGGEKLEHGLKTFQIDPAGKICLDIGASTGGFTDLLLKYKAKKVWAVDVGYNQLDYRLREDSRVVSLERTNARTTDFKSLISDKIELIVIDVSFISLKLALIPSLESLEEDGTIVALLKPQFEVGREKVRRKGVVKDKIAIDNVIKELITFFEANGLSFNGITESPIKGAKSKNTEYLLHLKKNKILK